MERLANYSLQNCIQRPSQNQLTVTGNGNSGVDGLAPNGRSTEDVSFSVPSIKELAAALDSEFEVANALLIDDRWLWRLEIQPLRTC
jgi:hypothetical protein